MEKHAMTTHYGFECYECGKIFKTLAGMERHVMETHYTVDDLDLMKEEADEKDTSELFCVTEES